MKRRSLPLLIAVSILSLFLLLVLTVILVPVDEVKGVVTRALAREGYLLQAEEFRKSFPLGIGVTNAEVRDDRGLLLKLDSATFRLKLLPLCIGKIVLDAHARIRDGEVSVSYQPRTSQISLHSEGIRLQDLPLLQVATGANLQGELFLDGSFSGRGTALHGDLRMEIKRAEFSGIKVSDMPLPDASYETIRGMFRAAGGTGNLESLTFQGDGIYIRLKGTLAMAKSVGAAPLNLTIELMPKPDFLEKQKLVFLLLAKYQKSPGSYQIPVTGTLLSPVIR
ncbi:MAG: type II secretion system protein GspN [Deltaproteobacteria bacterium]|nr:type II secretion system protein GspN [Deltaproteobacteria bacterium]TLN03416.1 MAG: type II secretion system protein GspN [bacterium]